MIACRPARTSTEAVAAEARAVLFCACVVGLAPAPGDADEYLLQPGDALSVLIVGAADLERVVPVEMNGTGWFPVIGEVPVAGSTLREVRERVADAYSVTSLPATSNAGSAPRLIQPSQVHVAVEEYKPIYISGDLLKPSTVDFRPGLTLQQAIVLAGVADAGERTEGIVREQVEAAILALAQAFGRIWSLKALLGTDTPQDYENIFVADTAAIEEIVELERSLVEARTEERERQERTIAANIERAEARLDALLKQKTSEEEAWLLDEQIVADIRELVTKGLAPTSRLSEGKRAAVASASRVLELHATIEDVRSEVAELEMQAELVKVGARSEAWSELSETITRVHELRAELAVLRAAGAAGAMTRTDLMAVITRRGEILPPVDLGSADPDLQPGDLIEILFRSSDRSRS